MNESVSNKRKLLYFILTCLLVVFALGAILYALGVFERRAGSVGAQGEPEQRYRHISMSEAQTACEGHSREAFGQRLFALSMDKFSSRLDRKEDLYKLFFQAELFEATERQGSPKLYYINCFTGTQSPKIKSFEYSADGQDFVKPGEEQQGLFGI